MDKVTYEEVVKVIKKADYFIAGFASNAFYRLSFDDMRIIEEFIAQHRPPTLDEVVKAWEEKEGWQVRESSSTLEIYSEWSKEVYYRIDFDTSANGIWQNPRYPKRTMQQDDLIQLTRRYLQSQKENTA